MRLNRGRSGNIGIAESRLLHAGSRRNAGAAGGHAAAEARAGHDPARTLCSACAIAVSRPGGHIKSACLCDVDGTRLSCTRGHTIRVAEATRLYLLWGAVDGLRRGVSRGKHVRTHGLLRHHRSSGGYWIRPFRRNLYLGKRHIFHWLQRLGLGLRSRQAQSGGRRVENRHDRLRQLPLRRMIFRDRSGYQFDRVVVLLWPFHDRGMKKGDPYRHSDDDRLRAVAHGELMPRRLPLWQGRKQYGSVGVRRPYHHILPTVSKPWLQSKSASCPIGGTWEKQRPSKKFTTVSLRMHERGHSAIRSIRTTAYQINGLGC